jgi:hypothetical protein
MWPFTKKRYLSDVRGTLRTVLIVDTVRVRITGIPMISAEPKPVCQYAQKLIDQAYPDWPTHEVLCPALRIDIDAAGNEVATWEVLCNVTRPAKLEKKPEPAPEKKED